MNQFFKNTNSLRRRYDNNYIFTFLNSCLSLFRCTNEIYQTIIYFLETIKYIQFIVKKLIHIDYLYHCIKMSIFVFMFVVLMTLVTDTLMFLTLIILAIWSHNKLYDYEEVQRIEYVSDSE